MVFRGSVQTRGSGLKVRPKKIRAGKKSGFEGLPLAIAFVFRPGIQGEVGQGGHGGGQVVVPVMEVQRHVHGVR